MATIGLDKLFYADITEDANGNETYGKPKQLAKAISADLSVELNEATLYADDGQAEAVKEFKSGTLSLGVDDIGHEVAADLVGATLDNKGVLISGSEDTAKYVAVGFRAKRRTESISIIGFTECCSVCLRPTLLQRAIRFLSRRRLSKALSFVGINLTERKIILGKQRLPNRRKTLR